MDRRDVIDHCANTTAPYKCPQIVESMGTLPKSATGKVLRNELGGEAQDRRLIEQEG